MSTNRLTKGEERQLRQWARAELSTTEIARRCKEAGILATWNEIEHAQVVELFSNRDDTKYGTDGRP